jgi:hypothetical protein
MTARLPAEFLDKKPDEISGLQQRTAAGEVEKISHAPQKLEMPNWHFKFSNSASVNWNQPEDGVGCVWWSGKRV